MVLLILCAWLVEKAAASPLLPGVEHLSEQQWTAIQKALTLPGNEKREVSYQRIVQRQIFSDLQTLYAPENAAKLKITYASFTPDLYHSPAGNLVRNAGEDAGLGLHIIKRLKLPLAEGGHRLIEVNEHWAQDRMTGGLFFPDEIRAKVQVARGPRRTAGSERLYLFDSFRLAWGSDREIAILRRTRFNSDNSGTEKIMRVPVSAPYSCMGCHRDYTVADYLAGQYLEPSEERTYESIVQDSHFARPLPKTQGFRDYMASLETRKVSAAFLAEAAADLARPEISMQLPGIIEALEKHKDSVQWMPEDVPWFRTYSSPAQALDQQATYPRNDTLYIDVIEDYFEGKYRWWFPEVVVPIRNPDPTKSALGSYRLGMQSTRSK